jgi:hypothetical protein
MTIIVNCPPSNGHTYVPVVTIHKNGHTLHFPQQPLGAIPGAYQIPVDIPSLEAASLPTVCVISIKTSRYHELFDKGSNATNDTGPINWPPDGIDVVSDDPCA